jgi:phosphatidylserine/phosphatidylglycerophosphate/cardiolipin synthase-like enzyme
MNKLHLSILAVALTTLTAATPAEAKKKSESLVDAVVDAYEANHSFTMPAAGTIEVAFSPNEGGEALVVKVIDSAKTELRVLSYSFTSAPVTSALLRAKKRGVDVRLEVDA